VSRCCGPRQSWECLGRHGLLTESSVGFPGGRSVLVGVSCSLALENPQRFSCFTPKFPAACARLFQTPRAASRLRIGLDAL